MAANINNSANKTPAETERPKNLSYGRWLGDFPNLSTAELGLVECCRTGEVWAPEEWDLENPIRPEAESEANRIRADLIRFLALGGDALHPVQEEGVNVWGAWITGTLSLHHCHAPVRLDLRHCHLVNSPTFMAAELPELALIGSRMRGLNAERMKVAGSVFLRDGFITIGEVRLLGANIGGDLDCVGGSFTNACGNTLSAVSMKLGGSLILRQPKYKNEPKHKTAFEGSISVTAARIATLVDDASCWQSGGHFLDGFQYDRIIGPVDAVLRINWLKSQNADHLGKESWRPQPWEQLIKVLRETGHPGAAADIAMEKQRMMRKAGQIGTRISRTDFPDPWRNRLDARWAKLSNAVARGFHRFYGAIAGYGHRPTRIAAWMLAVWLVCSLFFEAGREYGHFGPSSPVINSSAALNDCGARGETTADGSPKAYWHSLSCPMPAEYTTLWPPLYSLDLILPLIDLQQDSDWAPIVANENGEQQFWGYVLRALMWFEILFGWVASLMFVAIVSRLVDKD